MALQSLDFNGSSHYVSCGNVPTSGLVALTVEGWFYLDDVTPTQGLVSKDGGTAQDWALYTLNSGQIGFRVKNATGTAQTAIFTTGVSEKVWFHAAGVYDGSTVKVYVNGTAGGVAPAQTGNVATSTQVVEMGRYSGAGYLNGRIGWARISNTARYTANFNVMRLPAKKDANTKAQWNFTEGSGTTLDNIEGTATYDGSVTGATWLTDTPWPHTVIDSFHVFEVLVDGADYWANIAKGSLRYKVGIDSQIPVLDFTVEETGASLNFAGWKEVLFTIDGKRVFGGYVTKARPTLNKRDCLTWEIQAEGWITEFNRGTSFRKTYTRKTPGYILADLFTEAGLTGYDTATHVTAGTTLDHFYVDGDEKLTDTLDRLTLLAGNGAWVWTVDAEKAVWFGLPSANVAPFSLAATASANCTSSFPMLTGVTKDIDETDIRNRITVVGGTTPSDIITDTFNGDGSTLLFTLTSSPIYDVQRVTVDGVVHPHGVDWVHTYAQGYRCLVNYITGTVRWDTGDAPTAGTGNVIVKYRTGTPVEVVRTSAVSYALYGRYFDYKLVDGSITTEAEATLAADALLATYALPNVWCTAEVERWGIMAGQYLSVTFALLGLTGSFTVQEVVAELSGPESLRCTVKFGGKLPKVRNLIVPQATGHGTLSGGNPGGAGTIGAQAGGGSLGGSGGGGAGQPPIDREINIARLNRRLEIIDRATDYDPSTYGDATGVVIEYDPDTGHGRILGLNGGDLQGYFDSNGAIKGGGGTVIINEDGIAIVSPNGAPSANEKYRFASADLADTYAALYAYRGLNDTNAVLEVSGTPEDDLSDLALRASTPTTKGASVTITADSNGTQAQVILSANDDLLGAVVSAVYVTGDTEITGTFLATEGAVVNESGADSDTRIEGNTDANLVFVDAGNDRVGIGTAAPDSKLQVIGEIRLGGASNYLKVDSSGQLSLVGDATQFREVFLPGHAMHREGAAPGFVAAVGGIYYPAFDAASDESLFGTLLLPADYKDGSNITASVRWFADSNAEANETVRWGLEYVWVDKEEVGNSTTEVGVTAPSENIAEFKRYDSAFSAITGTGKAGGSTLEFRVFRDANHGDDDWASDAYLVGLVIRYEVDKLGANT